jgi:hypothetical protein
VPGDPPIFQKELSVLGDGSAGQYDLIITAAESLALPVHKYFHDIWRVDPGLERQWVWGFLNIKQGVRLL